MPVYGKIKLLREQCGITSARLAELTNWSQSQISKMENGKCSVDSEKLEILREALGCSGVPITEEEVDNFRQRLYDFYNSIKNNHLAEARENSDCMKALVEKCFESEFKILYYLFESYLLMRELKYDEARRYLEVLENNFSDFNDEQSYYYNYFYAASVYKDYALALHHFLKAEEFAKKIHKQEASLYYSIANMYARIDYSPKSIIYGKMALDLAQSSSDKAYLLNIEVVIAFEYSKLGFHQLAIDGLNGCLMRDKATENMQGMELIYHNLGCVYLSMKDYSKASDYFDKALGFCTTGDWSYLTNKLYAAYILISTKEKERALILLEELLPLAKDTPDVLLLIESAKHSLDLSNEESLAYIENITIPKLLKSGEHLTAIDYMNVLSCFYERKNSLRKSSQYAKLALSYTTKLLKGEFYYEKNY